ncbi:MAG: glycosyltransferase family 4 protein [Chloroflexi bacterium]|nr:glycosyltransferase family 4 protein [Ardenticatenaceae bacterium]MBL1129844.1 glycosyltransferase family 1 protein [Chloroflexota bacterium]NOG35929.1 glycosyltransferase family 4 protein [Chloroflexota bacterium]GIK56232.1 MAG: glycosyl transferase family 1 [Chloroflexota bacterium]
MRILMLSPAYPPFPGGGERYVAALAAELARRGHEVTAVTSAATLEKMLWQGTGPERPIAAVEEGVTVIRCGLRPFPGGRPALMAWRKAMVMVSMLPGNQTAVLSRMARYIPPITRLETTLSSLPRRFHVVHGFNISWEWPMLAGWQFARQQYIPYVATPFAHLGTGHDRVTRNSTMTHQLRLLADADRVLALTEIEKSGLAAWGVSPDRLDVVGTGLDSLPVWPEPAPLLAQHHVQPPYVLFVGRTSSEKGAIDAAQAVLALRRQGTAVTLLLIGQPAPEFDRFYARLSEQDKQGVRPLGILSDADKHGLLAGAAALLLPSRTDSFGIVLLEAWAHGVPVIAARAGGIPGVVDDGHNGLLVQFGDVPDLSQAIYQLLADEALRTRLGQHGRAKIETIYIWTAVADRVLANYEMIRSS